MPTAHKHPGRSELRANGPILRVALHPLSIPGIVNSQVQPTEADALIDTGASFTSICVELANKMGYPQVGKYSLTHAGGSSDEMPVFMGSVELKDHGIPKMENVRLWGTDLRTQAISMLIGRDILVLGDFRYNGPSGTWALTIPAPAQDVTKPWRSTALKATRPSKTDRQKRKKK